MREMLAAAAVPLDLERAQLLEHSLVLKKALQDARATLSAEQQVPARSKPAILAEPRRHAGNHYWVISFWVDFSSTAMMDMGYRVSDEEVHAYIP